MYLRVYPSQGHLKFWPIFLAFLADFDTFLANENVALITMLMWVHYVKCMSQFCWNFTIGSRFISTRKQTNYFYSTINTELKSLFNISIVFCLLCVFFPYALMFHQIYGIMVFQRIIETVVDMDENFEHWYFLKIPSWKYNSLKAYTTGLILRN